MTAPARHLPSSATVVEVHGSRFLLEWLDRDVLATAAALRLQEDPGGPPRSDGEGPVSAH